MILDAVQFALVGGQRAVKFNQAAMAGRRRITNGFVHRQAQAGHRAGPTRPTPIPLGP